MVEQDDPNLLQELCEQASREKDSEKLLSLTQQICQILDKKRSQHRGERSKKSA